MDGYLVESQKAKRRTSPRLLFWAASAYSVGVIFLAYAWDWRKAGCVLILAAGLLLLAGSFIWGRPELRLLALGTLAACVTVCCYSAFVYLPAVQWAGISAPIRAIALEDAQGLVTYGSVPVRLLEVDGKSARGSRAVLYLRDGSPDIKAGDILSGYGAVREASPTWRADGVFLIVRQVGPIIVSAPDGLASWRVWPYLARQAIWNQITQILPQDQAGLLYALFCGDRQWIDKEDALRLTNSGLSHIVAVSGLHVSMVAGLLVLLFGRRWGSAVALVAVMLFALLAGGSPSVVRASILTSIVLVGFFLRRESDTLTSLSLALALILAARPLAAHSVGLQLSFTAVLGLVLFTPVLQQVFTHKEPKNKLMAKCYRAVTSAFAASFAAQILTLPLLLWYFPRISLMTLISNLLVLPVVSLALGLGMLLIPLSFVSAGLTSLLARWSLGPVMSYLLAVARGLGGLPFATAASHGIYLPLFSAVLLAVFVALKWIDAQKLGTLLLVLMFYCLCLTAQHIEERIAPPITICGRGGGAMVLGLTGGQAYGIQLSPSSGDSGADLAGRWLSEQAKDRYCVFISVSPAPKAEVELEKIADAATVGSFWGPEGLALPNWEMARVYKEPGAIELGAWTLELRQGGKGRYAARLLAGKVSLLSVCGVEPLAFLRKNSEADLNCDILVLDQAFAQTPVALNQLVALSSPRIVVYADTGYGEPGTLENIVPGKVIYLSQEQHVTIRGG